MSRKGSVGVVHKVEKCIDCNKSLSDKACVFLQFLDMRRFATGSGDNTVSLWDLRNPSSKVCILRGHADMVKDIEFVSRRILTSSFDGFIHVWDIN